MHRRLIPLCLTLLLIACHAPIRPPNDPTSTDRAGTVSYDELPSFATEQYKLKRSEHAFGAQPVTHDAPAYPAALISKQLPETTIRVKAIVDEQGHVTDVRDLDVSTDPDHAAFFAACRDALSRWMYTPMTVVNESDDGHGNVAQKRRNVAFSLDYGFRFALVGGAPTVSAER